VVVAAGNDAGLAVAEPANCPGAIAVAGVRHAGSKVGYSNLGPQVAIAAPAGNCVNVGTGEPCLYPLLTTDNTGTKAPSTNTYSDSYNSALGTSFASPIVAGTVGLMLSVDPSLTPARVKTLLQSTARVFPVTGSSDTTVVACKAPSATEQLECYCTTTTCGAGLLDAGKVVTQVQAALAVLPTAAFTVSNASPTAGASVTLDAGGSSAITGRSIASYQWQITTGGSLASFTGAIDGKVASLATSAAGSVVVTLTVTDNQGSSRSTSQSLTVAAAPVVTPPAASGGSGGGAMGWPWLAGLALAVLALAVTRRSAS
jgi:serine protease